MGHPMGESKRDSLRVDFDRRLKLEFHGSKITSDAGLLAYRELDDALGLTEMAEGVFQDSRTGKNGWHGKTGQFRQSVFGRLGGYDDVNDADRLGRDPAMRWIVGGKAIERQAASTSQMGRFETELLATDENVEALVDMNGVWIDKVHDRHPPKMIILDMDSSVSPTHGEQEGCPVDRGLAYGLRRVCAAWGMARSSFYAMTSGQHAEQPPAKRRGPKPAISDQALLVAIEADLEASPWEGEGYRKVWARLRVCRDIRVTRKRVLRLMRENNLLSPHRCRRRGGNPHDGEIHHSCPEPHVGHRWRSGVHGGRRLGLDLQRTMVTSAVPATIRYSCSTSSATWRDVPCAPVMFTVPTDGGMFWSRW